MQLYWETGHDQRDNTNMYSELLSQHTVIGKELKGQQSRLWPSCAPDGKCHVPMYVVSEEVQKSAIKGVDHPVNQVATATRLARALLAGKVKEQRDIRERLQQRQGAPRPL